MDIGHCKPPRRDRDTVAATRQARWACLGACLLTIGACSLPAGPNAISVSTLESAPAVAAQRTGRAIVADLSLVQDLLRPMGQRLALLEVRSERDWLRLKAACPGLTGTPDFARGAIVGVVSELGQPLDGEFPVAVESVQVIRGAGYLSAHFRGGTYLPDGTAYIDTSYVEGLRAVLMVSVNGVRYYPQQG